MEIKANSAVLPEQVHGSYTSLLELPILIIDKIIGCLNSGSLRTLRCVCRTTKTWVDTPRFLRKISVHVDSDRRMGEIINSRVPWANMIICPTLCSDYTAPFLMRFKSSLTSLKIKGIHENFPFYNYLDLKDLLCVLLNVGPSLESLTIANGMKEDFEYLQNSLRLHHTRYMENLRGLRHFQIESIHKIGRQLSHKILTTMLDLCPNLVNIKLPDTTYYYQPPVSIASRDMVCQPLVNYIQQRIHTSTYFKTQPLKVDFGQVSIEQMKETFVHDRISLPRFHMVFGIPLIPLTTEALLQIASMSRKSANLKIELEHVPQTAFPEQASISAEDKQNLDLCVRSVVCIISPGIFLQDGYVPSSSELHLVIKCDGQDGLQLVRNVPEGLNVISLKVLDCFMDEYCEVPQPTFSKPGIKELLIQAKVRCAFSYHKNISMEFPNLTQLYLFGINDLDCFSSNGIFRDGLAELEELTLVDCRFIRFDLSGMGVRERFFNKFSKLKRLCIIRCDLDFNDSGYRR